MRSFIWKDFLMLWRDRKETLTILVLPIILVVVLNFAFANLFGGDNEGPMDLQLAVVNLDDEEKGLHQLEEKLIELVGKEETVDLMEKASYMRPVSMLADYLNSEEISEWVTVFELNEVEAMARVEDGRLDGLLLIPEGYTTDSLNAALVGEVPTKTLQFKLNKPSTNNEALYQIIASFLEQMNYQLALQEVAGVSEVDVLLPTGGLEELRTSDTFTLAQYFTIAIGILFSLFLASTIATKAGEEIRLHVFNRILVSDSNPRLFLIGKVVSSFSLALLQIMFVILVSNVILDVFPGRTLTFWLGVISLVSLFSLAIAGLAALFTSISLRIKNIDAANGIFMGVILFFGVIGGNFVPVYILPDWLRQIGEWTPNGLSLMLFTKWIQLEDVSAIIMGSTLLVGFFFLCLLVSVAMFPKRGETK